MANGINIDVYSQNCNGLGDRSKRLAVFKKLKKRDGIFLLQETHSTASLENIWCNDWGCNQLYFSHGESNQKGVLIAITKNYQVSVKKVIKDDEGRFIILILEQNGTEFTVGNIYAPTRNFENEQCRILNLFTKSLLDNITENLITSGDYNLYLNPRLDKLDTMPDTNDNNNYRRELKSFLESQNLTDVWRDLHPDQRMFTWHRGNRRSRLDYFFISEHLLNILHKTEILPGIHSDHSLISLSLRNVHTDPRGRGFWKFNNSLLEDLEYVNMIKTLLPKIIEKYNHIQNKGLVWDLVKLEIRKVTMHYSGKKGGKMRPEKNY